MIQSRNEALQVLGLEEDKASEEEIRVAFTKRIHRFPQQHFPDRFAQFKEALDYLTDPTCSFIRILNDSLVDLSFLDGKFSQTKTVAMVTFPKCLDDQTFTAKLLRCALLGNVPNIA